MVAHPILLLEPLSYGSGSIHQSCQPPAVVCFRRHARAAKHRRGGATASCTRSIRARSRTPTATASATCAGSSTHLDHLEWLGVDGIWLNPTMPSPNDDWGYDVADLPRVHPDLGTLEDLDDAGRRGGPPRHPRAARPGPQPHQRPPRVVPGRACAAASARTATSTSGPTQAPDGSPPNNWRLGFGGPAWTLDEPRASTTSPVPADPARPELVERRGARSVRRDPALLVRPRRLRLPHRRLPRDRQGPRAARRPRRDRRRPPARPRVRAAAASTR